MTNVDSFKGRRLLTFAVVGGFVLLVDMAAFRLASDIMPNVFASRLASLLVAMYASYVLNTKFTFGASNHKTTVSGFAMFALSQAFGAAANAAVSISILSTLTDEATRSWLPFAAGSATGLSINFLLARRLLDRGNPGSKAP